LTLNTLKVAGAKDVIAATQSGSTAKGVQLVAGTILKPPANAGRGGGLGAVAPYTPAEEAVLDKGREVYTQVCFACHGEDGRGQPVPGDPSATLGPPLAASPTVLGHSDWVIKTLLHGLSGPLHGRTYPGLMVGMGQNPDQWIAAVGSYVRNAFGNRAALVSPHQVARVRAATASRKTPWTTAELEASMPRLLVVDDSWKLTASHNAAIASQALSIRPWTSGVRQEPGMWLQVELPAARLLTGLQFTSPPVLPEATPAVPGAPTRTGIGRGGDPNAPAPQPGFPRGFKVQVSLDGAKWTDVATGQGAGKDTDVAFAPVRAKYVRISQTATAQDAPPFAIAQLRLYEPGSGTTANR
jgi:mono/diheme cytochrome c family protein